jgi:hypothetical protein
MLVQDILQTIFHNISIYLQLGWEYDGLRTQIQERGSSDQTLACGDRNDCL